MNIDNALYRRIAAAGQEQLLRYWDELDAAGQARLKSQLEAINFEELSGLIRDYVLRKPETVIPADLAPAKYFPLVPADEATRKL